MYTIVIYGILVFALVQRTVQWRKMTKMTLSVSPSVLYPEEMCHIFYV